VAKALSPAQVIEVRIDEEHRIANVVVPERMLSLAIGREGQNARLAAKLTGWRIDIRSDVSVAEAAAEAVRVEAEAESAETTPEAVPIEIAPAEGEVAAIEEIADAVAAVAAESADVPAKPKRRKAVKSTEAVGDGEVSS
jgi:N utilization substance protein A